jgi:hypothetical protein
MLRRTRSHPLVPGQAPMVQIALACLGRAHYSECHEGKDSPRRALHAISNDSRPVLIPCDKYIDGRLNPMLASSHPSGTPESFSRARNMTNSIGKPVLSLPNGFCTWTPPESRTWSLESATKLARPSIPAEAGIQRPFHPPLLPLQAGIVASLEFRV